MTVSVPFIKYSSKEEIVKKSLELVEHGADSSTLWILNLNFMKYLNEFKIPFQGHAGLVPRRSTWIGGVRAFGKNAEEASKLLNDIEILKKQEHGELKLNVYLKKYLEKSLNKLSC